jgi:hypothetical protein
MTQHGKHNALRLPKQSFAELFGEVRTDPPVRPSAPVPGLRDEEREVRPEQRASSEEGLDRAVSPDLPDEEREVRPEQRASSEEGLDRAVSPDLPVVPPPPAETVPAKAADAVSPDLPVVPPPPAETVPAKAADAVIVTESSGKDIPADPFLDYQGEPAPAAVAAARTLAAALPAAAPAKPPVFRPIDLRPYANQKLAAPFPGGDPGNDLAGLPAGAPTLGGVEFAIGDGVVHLGSARVAGPQKVEGIAVGGRFARLHVLHGCDWSSGTGEGEVIARFVLHHEDGTAAEAPVVYGQHVRDWWSNADEKDPPRSKIGWEGENEAVKGSGIKIKLWLTTWRNPHPEKEVVSIDYVAAAATTAVAPFCVAITVEES